MTIIEQANELKPKQDKTPELDIKSDSNTMCDIKLDKSVTSKRVIGIKLVTGAAGWKEMIFVRTEDNAWNVISKQDNLTIREQYELQHLISSLVNVNNFALDLKRTLDNRPIPIATLNIVDKHHFINSIGCVLDSHELINKSVCDGVNEVIDLLNKHITNDKLTSTKVSWLSRLHNKLPNTPNEARYIN